MEKIVFPNKIREVRNLKGMEMGALADEVGMHISAISKIEKGYRRPNREQLKKIATALGVKLDRLAHIPKAKEVDDWAKGQLDQLERMVEDGRTALAQVVKVLRKKHKKTIAEAAKAVGLPSGTYHRIETGVRTVTNEERRALAKFYGMSDERMIELLEATRADHVKKFKKKRYAELMPRVPQSLLLSDRIAPQGTVAVVRRFTEVESLRRAGAADGKQSDSANRVLPRGGAEGEPQVPIYGKLVDGKFLVDRESTVGYVAAPPAISAAGDLFAVRLFASRLGVFYRPMSLVFCDDGVSVSVGDVALMVRKDGQADIAIVVSNGMDPALQMYGPDEKLSLSDPSLKHIWRVRGVILP
jgi:transcriptional regulator with XRE-family HTH domain